MKSNFKYVRNATLAVASVAAAMLASGVTQARTRSVQAEDYVAIQDVHHGAGECWDKCTDADYHFSGTVGRLGLGADPHFPEGPGAD